MSKKKAILIVTSLFIVIFLGTGFFIIRDVYNKTLDGLINQYAQEKLVLAKQTAVTLEDEIKSMEDKLKLIANIPEIREAKTEACNKKLEEIAKLNTRISNIGRVGVDRKFKCSLNKAIIGLDAQTLGPYIAQIFNDPEHKTVMSRIIKVPNGGYAVALHVPVYDAKGEFAGTVGGGIYFDEFSKKFLQDVKVSDQGYVVLQDDDGTIFYHPQKDLIGQNRRPKTKEEEATASAITSLIIKSSQDGSTGFSRYISTLDQKEKVGAYAPADVLPGRKWVVIVTVPREEILKMPLILEARKAFQQLFFLVIVSIIALPLLILVYLIYSVFRPLEKIGKAASEIGNGNLDVTIPIKSQDEIGKMATLFNKMASQLKASYQGLEEKVQSKTHELDEKVADLEKTNKLMVNRELRIIELKDEIKRLKGET